MKRILLVMLLILSQQAFGQIKDGFYQYRMPFPTAGWLDGYEFRNGRVTYYTDEYDWLNPIRSISGIYEIRYVDDQFLRESYTDSILCIKVDTIRCFRWDYVSNDPMLGSRNNGWGVACNLENGESSLFENRAVNDTRWNELWFIRGDSTLIINEDTFYYTGRWHDESLINPPAKPKPSTDSTIEPIFDGIIDPEYPGGMEAMYQFIKENLNYPQEARDSNVTGRVYITFIIEKDGSLTDIKCIRDIGCGCGDEAIRIVKMMPHWKPGTQGGVPVRTRFNIPINFTLRKE